MLSKKVFLNSFSLIIMLSVGLLMSCSEETTTDDQATPTTLGTFYIDSLSKAINKTPEKAILYAQRGEAYYELESYEASINDLNKAIELDDSKPNFYRILANSYLDYYRSKEGLEVLERAAKKFPTDIGILLKLSEFQLFVKRHGESIQTAQSILQISPMNPEAFFMLGLNYKQIEDTVRAIGSFQTAVEQDPDLLDGFYELGLLHQKQGKKDLAKAYFDNALKVDSTNIDVLYAKGMLLMEQRKDNEAIEIFQKVNKYDSQYPNAYFNIGIIFLEYDSLKKAFGNFNIAAEMDQTMAKAYFYRAVTSEKMGNKQDAIRDYENARNFDTENVFTMRIENKLAQLR
jgi:tetratricopeptide (TPR) repeat protein